MKFLFLLLLLSNLLITWLAWRQPAHENPVYVDVNLPRVSVLQLASELPQMTAAEKPVDRDRTMVEPIRESSASVIHEADESEPRQQTLAEVPPEILAIDEPRIEEPEVALPPPKTFPKDQPETVQCVVVSGFAGLDSAQAWLDAVALDAVAAGAGERVVSDDPLHWVLVPPLPGRAEGQALLNSLATRNIDSYLIVRPPYRNAVSLGLYRSKAAAESVLRRRQEEGIDAVLAEYPRERQEYFVAMLAAAPAAVYSRIGEKLTARVERGSCRALQ